MKLPLFLLGLAFLASANLITIPALFARSPQAAVEQTSRERRPVVAIAFNDGKSITTSAEGGLSDLVGLQPEEIINLRLTFPTSAAGQRIMVQSLDGGFASGAGNTVGPDGSLDLTFQAAPSPGLNRILVINQGTSSILRFWVINNAQPAANPPQLR